jgi:hypothetical protein
MLTSLKKHPFGVRAFFEQSLVITYAIPKDEIKQLIPECLELDTYEDKWGFVALALIKARSLRPMGFPRFLGSDFFLAGYRIFVKYKTKAGKRLRGLYILKSETDNNAMAFLGNIFTHYNYTITDIDFTQRNNHIKVKSHASSVDLEVIVNESEPTLPVGSPFSSWQEARRFAGPLPFTFTYNHETKEVLIIEGLRKQWLPHAVDLVSCNIGFFKRDEFKNAVLANAFLFENIPYQWQKGRIEKWEPS